MKHKKATLGTVLVWTVLSLSLTGCGGAKVLKEPEPLVSTQAVAVAADQQLSARLDWVIVRDGPGTWASSSVSSTSVRTRSLSPKRTRSTSR